MRLVRINSGKARIELLTLFLLFIALGMGTVALGNLPSQAQPVPTVQSPPSGTYFDHVVFIMMENEGLQNICGGNPPPCNGSNTPFMSSLATNYTVAQQYTSVYRPITSAPNYVAIIGASTFNCTASCPGNINAPTLIDRFLSVGLTWKGYFENMGQSTGCVTGGSSPYNSSHNPFISFKEFVNNGTPNATMCNNIVLANPSGCGSVTDCNLVNDLNNASSTAPSFLWLTPNDCNNMHAASICTTGNGYNGCTTPSSTACIKGGDNYLKSLVPNILNSRTFKNSRSALYITFDEGQDYCPFNGSSSEDCIYASWSGPIAKNGFIAPSAHLYNHYNFTHTVEVNWSLATLTTHDAGSGPMTEFFSNQPPNFTINPSPPTISFPTGGSGNSTITLQSTSNFSGTVTLTKSSKPSTGITLTLNPSSVTLTSGGTATSLLTASSSTLGTYNVTITGTSGSLIHNATLTVSVTPPPDFQISNNPSSLILGQVSTGASKPVTISPTGDQTVFESSYLVNSFYAKGLYWLFYEDSRNTCEHVAGCLEYTTSFNGSSWATPTTVPVHVTDSVFSVYSDGSNVYYVRYNDTTFENVCGRNLQFREGALSTSGSVTWQPEQTIVHASSTRLYANPYVILDSNGQAWVGLVSDLHGACGGNGNDTPQVVHSSGTNYASWSSFFNLTLVNSGNWHIALASLGSGQIYASYWITNTDVHGRLYNGSWQSDEQISSPVTLADINSWLFNSGTSLYMIYFDNLTETYNFASRSSTGTWTDSTIGHGETHTGTRAFNSNYYALPDAASYDKNANTFFLFYMNSTTRKIDQWSGAGTTWTKTTGIVSTGTVPYADSVTSFIQATTPTTGSLFYISGSSSPFNINAATLTFATNSTTGSFQTIITAQYGFTGTVNLTTTISPSTGLTVNCNPTTITGGTGASNCLVNSTIAGNYTVTVTGTSGTLNHSATVAVTAPGSGPDFTITASAPAPANTGVSTTTTITIAAVGGFTGTVSLTDTVPTGLICGSITPTSVTGSGTATVTCHSLSAGNYTLTVTGTSGSLVHSANATFRIQDFTISSTTPVTVNAGSNGTTTVTTASQNGFGGTISLTDTVPTGLICGAITPNSITGSGTATIACNSNTAGNYTLTITGTSASLVHTTTTLFIIQNFTIAATSPGAANVSQSAISTITITAQNHFGGVVTLTDSIPSGLSCGSITPGSLAGSGTATLSCSATIAANYTLTISAKNGSLTHNATATFRFQDYTISASSPIIANAGSNATSTITITAHNGFGGTVTLTDTIPSGLTCGAITPVTVTGSGTATVTCHSAAGNYTLTITGTSGSLVHSANATFQVRDFTITASTPVTTNAGSSGSSTITIAALNQFAGTVSLTDSIPTGLVCGTISPSSITGSGTATVGCSSTVAGNYTLTVTGTSTTLIHTVGIIFIIQNFTTTATSPTAVYANRLANSTITISSQNHFSGIVVLSNSSPSGLTCNPVTPNSVTGSGSAILSCKSAIAGNYTVTITGTSGLLVHNATAIFRFQDYTIIATTPISTNAGSNSTTTITITGLNGFGGTVTMNDTIPSGLTCGLITPTSITGSGTATIACSSSTAGNYTLTVTGTSASLVHSTAVLFIIQNFTITATSPAAVNAGQSAISTVTITAQNHFAGTVTLADVIPTGLACGALSPGTVNGSGTATVSCSASVAGNYTLTLTAKNGQLVHAATAIFQFRDFTLTASTPVTANAGSNGSSTITISALNQFSGSISLSDSIPSGLVCGAITPSSVTGSGTATVACSSTITGNYTLTVTGTSTTLTHTATITYTIQDFTTTATSPAPVFANRLANSTITITSQNHFSGTVVFSNSLPSGLSCNPFAPSSVNGSGSATLSCTSAIAGNYTVTVTGMSGTMIHNATATFRFQDFTIAATSSVTTVAGTNISATITVSGLNRFAGTVSFTDIIPSGLACGPINPNSVTGSGTATVSCSSTAAGNYTLTLTGTSSSLIHSTTVMFIVEDFTITATSPSTVDPGLPASLIVTVGAQNHFSQTVTFSDTLQSGLTCGPINPGSLPGSGTTQTTCSVSAVGNYSITITGQSGSLSHSTAITVKVADFKPTAPSTITSPISSNSTTILTISGLNGYSGNVTLSATVQIPPGPGGGTSGGGGGGGGLSLRMAPPQTDPTVYLNPQFIILTNGGSAQSNVTVVLPPSLTPGIYLVIITATDGGLSHTVTITLTATDFTITGTSNLTIQMGGNATQTLTVQFFNGFQGSIDLTAGVTPSGPTATLNPTTIFSNGNPYTQLTILVPANTAPGNYTLTILATSGTLSHSLTITITVSSAGMTAVKTRVFNSNSSILYGILASASVLAILSIRNAARNHSGGNPARRSRIRNSHRKNSSRLERHGFVSVGPLWTPVPRDLYYS